MSKVPLTRSRYKNGYYTLINPTKYVGDPKNVIYRSNWEHIICKWFDSNPSVVQWSSELIVIPYLSKLDNKMHNYHVDFLAKMRLKTGQFKTYLIEIKPNKERFTPKPTRNKERFMKEMSTYIVNQSKWEAADAYCKAQGIEFLVLDEYDIGIKKR